MQKKTVIVATVCLSTLSGCDHWCNRDTATSSLPAKGDNMVALTRHVISDDSLSVSYRVTNSKDHPVWVCDGIDAVGQVDITVKGNTVYLRAYSRGLYPEGMLLYVPPMTFYSRLSPGESIERTIRVQLPVSEQTRHVHIERDGGGTSEPKVVTRVVVQLGYLTQQSIDTLGPYVRSLSQDRIHVAALEVRVEESIMEMSMSDVIIPIAYRARD